MFPEPVLLALPTQSVAVRLLVGAIVAGVLVRLLLRVGLRAPRLRVAASQLPGLALLVIGLASVGAMRLPSMVRAFDGTLPTDGTTYETLVGLALPALAATWAAVAGARVLWRIASLWRLRRQARRDVVGSRLPTRVRTLAVRLAAQLGIDTPRMGLRDELPGGAVVFGLSRPIVLLDGALADALDDQELEGVLAHEFAHIARRDNLVAFVLCLIGDLTFFVPGGRWSRRRLLIEREIATDEQAVSITRRPGALASGLLKVVDGVSAPAACAAFMPTGTLVTRIEHLVDTRPAPTRLRLVMEATALVSALAVCVLAATMVPRAIAGDEPDSGLGLALGAPRSVTPQPSPLTDTAPAVLDDGAVFQIYDLLNLSSTSPELDVAPIRIDDDPDLVRPDRLRACLQADARCTSASVARSLPLRPEINVKPAPELPRWVVAPVVDTGGGIGIYYLTRAAAPDAG